MPASILLESSPSFPPPSLESCHSLASPSPPLGQTRPAKSCNRRKCSWNAPLSSLPSHLGEVNNDPDYDIKSHWNIVQRHQHSRQPKMALVKVEQSFTHMLRNNSVIVLTQRLTNRHPLYYHLSKYFLIIVIRISRRKPKKSKG